MRSVLDKALFSGHRRSGLFRVALRTAAALALVLCAACTAPQTPQGKCDEAARELNEAARWGRMDIALERSAPSDTPDFLKRHAKWHKGTRILETELAGLRLTDPTNAIVQVDISWTMEDDTTLRVTRVEQIWSDDEGKWMLMEEKRIEGAEGLFGEEIEKAKPRRDKHFPTRVIH